MNIPATLRAGDTIAWTESLADYPASEGWILAIALRAKDKAPINISTTASGNDFAVSILIAASEKYAPGVYFYQAFIVKPVSPTEKYTVETGQIEILPNISAGTSQSDFRSIAKKNLDMLDARLSGDTSPDVMSYSIGGRSLSKRSWDELQAMRGYWKSEYEAESAKDLTDKGIRDPRHVGIRFERV